MPDQVRHDGLGNRKIKDFQMNRKIFFHPERCMLCHSCILACQMDSLSVSDPQKIPFHKKPPQRIRITFSRGTPWVWKCQHCLSAPCVEACVSGSLTAMEGGTGVIQHPETCVGCGSCLLVCPYGALSYDEDEKRVTKCNLCLEEDTPSCVKACQSGALVFQELNTFTQGKRKRMAGGKGEVHGMG